MFSFNTIVFLLFAFIVIISAIGAITIKNPVKALLSMILAFINTACIFILIGADFMGMFLIIIYVGAVMILFFFIVMTLNIKTEEIKAGFFKNTPFALLIGAIIIGEVAIFLSRSSFEGYTENLDNINLYNMAYNLYLVHTSSFMYAGFILLVGMIGAIVLTHRSVASSKKKHQDVSIQNSVKISDRISHIKWEMISGKVNNFDDKEGE